MPRVPKALPAIDPGRCTGCGWCVGVCPPKVLSLQVKPPDGLQDGRTWGRKCSVLHDAPACTGCALCVLRCPFDAIRMVRTLRPAPPIQKMK